MRKFKIIISNYVILHTVPFRDSKLLKSPRAEKGGEKEREKEDKYYNCFQIALYQKKNK